jgi:hypothetical protein
MNQHRWETTTTAHLHYNTSLAILRSVRTWLTGALSPAGSNRWLHGSAGRPVGHAAICLVRASVYRQWCMSTCWMTLRRMVLRRGGCLFIRGRRYSLASASRPMSRDVVAAGWNDGCLLATRGASVVGWGLRLRCYCGHRRLVVSLALCGFSSLPILFFFL